MANYRAIGSAFRFLPVLLAYLVPCSFAFSDGTRFLESGAPLVRGSDCGFLLDSPTRLKVDLSGEWSYSVEGGSAGKVKVPSAFDFTGIVDFERPFEIPLTQIADYQFSVAFFGVNYTADIWINGEFLGTHAGGYTSFVVPIPGDFLYPGKSNTIKVVVNNELDAKKTIPLRPRVWECRNYGGILRDVFLVATPVLHVGDISTETDLAQDLSTAKIAVHAAIEGTLPAADEAAAGTKGGPSYGFSCELVEKISGTSVARSPFAPLVRKGKGWDDLRALLTLPTPRLWTPDTPDLYLLKCYIVRAAGGTMAVIDEEDNAFGVRKLAVAGGDVMLNGKRTVLKGVAWHEDSPSWGSALPPEQMEKDVVMIKNLGANVIRFADHPPHPYMLDLCDRYGLLALEELPVRNTPAGVLADESYQELAKSMMKEMVARDRSHPSVLAWGIGDGFESSEAARIFVQALVGSVRAVDERPVYFVSAMLSGDSCASLVDIAAIDIGQSDPKVFRAQLEKWQTLHRDKPVVVCGVGSEVQPENRNGYSDPLSQEAQARYALQHLEAAKSLDYDGTILCSFNDWKGDRPALSVSSGDPWTYTTGLVSERRDKRLAYDAVRSFFHGERFVALPAGNHTSNAPVFYVLAGLAVLIGGAYYYNASRRFRESVNRSLLSSYNFFADIRDQHGVSLLHTTLFGIIISFASAIVASSILYHFRGSTVMDNLLSFLLVSDRVKVVAVREIWNPVRFIFTFSGAFFVGYLLASLLVLLLRTVFRARIYPYHAYTVTVWSTTPLLLLVPAGMILYRVMESSIYVLPSLALVALLFVWVLVRLLKGVAIIYDVLPFKVYLGGLATVLIVVAALYLYYDYAESLPMQVAFMLHMSGTSL